MNDAPKFLIEWPSRWDEFLSAIRPALGRSPERLAGEANTGLFPYWGILISWVFELAFLIAIIVIPAKLASMRPYEPPPKPKYDIIYYSGNELPKTEDVGGAEAGHSGRAGGREAYHPTQTIRVARGSTVRETVADAPKMNLPVSDSAVANLLALKALPGSCSGGRHAILPALSITDPNGGSACSPGGRISYGRHQPSIPEWFRPALPLRNAKSLCCTCLDRNRCRWSRRRFRPRSR